MTRAIQWVRHAIARILPEGTFKKFLRNLFEWYRERYYDPLGTLVNEVSMLEDGSLLVELDNGLKFYAQPDRRIGKTGARFAPKRYRPGYGKGHVSAETQAIAYFGTLWCTLREIYVDNIYKEHKRVKRGDVVVDAGAHIGLFTVAAAKAVGEEGVVIAIEPETDNLRFLEKNVRANGLRNVVIVGKGLWSQKRRLELSVKSQTSKNSLMYTGDDDIFEEIEVDTMDNLLEG